MYGDKTRNARASAVRSASAPMGEVIRVDEDVIEKHLDKIVEGTVEQTLNALFDAEADRLCGGRAISLSAVEGAGGHAGRPLREAAAHQCREVRLKMPKLRSLPFETAIIER